MQIADLGSRLPTLRDWQVIASEKWWANGCHGCFEVATGGGKTTFAIASFLSILKKNPQSKLLVVVPTTALLDQWYESFATDLEIDPNEIKVLRGDDLNPNALINLVVLNTARKFNGFQEKAQDLVLVVDECHRAGSDENSRALVRHTLATIGLSATPYRDFDDGFQTLIEPILGPVIFQYTLEDAIRDGVLADLRMINIKIPLLPHEQNEYEQLTKRIARAFAVDSTSEALNSLLRKRASLYNHAAYRIPVIAEVLAAKRGLRTLIFLESIEAAREAKALLESKGHSVTIYHSKMNQHLRRSNLKGFRKGLFDILIACRALDEGFNVPEAQLAIIAAGTSSRRQRIQRVGRVLRTLAGKNLGEVVTLYATPVEEKRLLEESERLGLQAQVSWQEVKVGT